MKVLIIEDNDILRENIKKFLEIKWCIVDDYSEYKWAVYQITLWNYDVIILDLWLWSQDGDGVDICREVREKWHNVPILMLTARTLTIQKVEWLESGADDYMVKPFEYDELFARIKSMWRRNNILKWNKLIFNDVEIEEDKMLVKQNGDEISLSKLEFKLLLFLAQNKWKVLKKETIIEKVWGEIDLFQESRNLDIYVWYVRKKMGKDIIETIHWVGYTIK